LPTHAEWQWATRSGDLAYKYPWGNEMDTPAELVCMGRYPEPGTCVVGAYPAGKSVHGVSDLIGGVWEWTSSAQGDQRSTAGGYWGNAIADAPTFTSTQAPSATAPSTRASFLGVRCALTP
jgi:formylglycine-generating enzyme required for sulfatase activity